LKGGTESHLLSFGFSIPELPTGFQAATVGEYGVFFFKTQNNAVSFFDPVHPSLPAVPQSSVPPGEPLDRVVATIGEVLESNRASTSDQIRVLDALGRLQSERASEILRQALKRTSGELRLRIAITLVAGNDISGLELVHATLLEPGNTSEGLLRDAAGCISGLRDPQAIPVLVKLIDSRNAEVRRSAAIALRQTQSSAALEALSHLLDDEDLLTRYYAVVGLGEITHQDEWTPAFEEFQHNERYYLSHWRTWVEANLR
jgi:HEAT repeat protein